MAEKAEKEEVRKRRPQRVTEGPLRGPQFKFIMRWVKYHWNVGPFWTKIGRGVEPLEVEKEIMELKEDVARLNAEVHNLSGWQKSQNGALLRVDQKVDSVNRKVDNLQKWILGVLATIVASIFINLAK